MKNLIIQASEVLEQEFGIKPNKSKLFIYEEIQEFLKNTKNPNAQSMFIPRNLSAHVPKNRIDLIFHEYHGHGLYCEHAKYGMKMVKDEKKFQNMKEHEVKNAITMHNYFKIDFEGHALLTEEFLLSKLNRYDVLEKRLKELEKLSFDSEVYSTINTQKLVFNRIKDLEKRYGKLHMWYYLGFPKMFSENSILELVKERLGENFNNLEFVILFGSKKRYSDIDLCVIVKDESKINQYSSSNIENIVDMPIYHKSDFLKKIEMFDLVATEPIITGNILFGNKNEFQRMKQYLKENKPTKESLDYMSKKIKECYENASNFLKNREKRSILNGLVSLTYALSYEETLFRYKNGSRVALFSEIKNKEIEKIRNEIKRVESNIILTD